MPDSITMCWRLHDYSWESAGADDGELLGDRGRVLAKWSEELQGLITRCRLRGVRLTFEPDKYSGAVAGSLNPAVWDAINEYVTACGGDTGLATVGNRRMDAVVEVERTIAEQAGSGGGVKGGAGAHAGAGPRRPDQSEVCDSDFDDEAAAELCKEIAEEHRRGA